MKIQKKKEVLLGGGGGGRVGRGVGLRGVRLDNSFFFGGGGGGGTPTTNVFFLLDKHIFHGLRSCLNQNLGLFHFILLGCNF